MEITLSVKSHYGVDHIYVNGEPGKWIRSLTGRKTVTGNDLDMLRALGVRVAIPAEQALRIPEQGSIRLL